MGDKAVDMSASERVLPPLTDMLQQRRDGHDARKGTSIAVEGVLQGEVSLLSRHPRKDSNALRDAPLRPAWYSVRASNHAYRMKCFEHDWIRTLSLANHR